MIIDYNKACSLQNIQKNGNLKGIHLKDYKWLLDNGFIETHEISQFGHNPRLSIHIKALGWEVLNDG